MIAVLVDVAERRRVPFAALAVLTILVHRGWVTQHDWRPLKNIAVARLTKRSVSQVCSAVRWLTAHGYLECQRHDGYRPLYRIRGEG